MNKEILRNDIIAAYSKTMSELYKKYESQSPAVLRLCYLSIITRDIAKKSAAHINSQTKKITAGTNKIKTLNNTNTKGKTE